MSMSNSKIIDAHFCPMSDNKMKPWHSFICSQCMGKGTDLAVPEEEIRIYNKKNEKNMPAANIRRS